MPRPVVLMIMDGWGMAPPGPGNAVALAKTPNFDKFWASSLHTQLLASGEAVGLTRGEDGNSETGHLNLGAGQVVFQDLPRIDLAIAGGSFFQIPAFKAAAEHVRQNKSSLHLIGLASQAGVHASLKHLYALLHFYKEEKISSVYIHLFTDGRDSPPTSALACLSQVETESQKIGVGKIATLCGRYYGMDRDLHWERTQRAYDLLVLGKGKPFSSLQDAVAGNYQSGKTDEFIEPAILDQNGLIKDSDAIIFFNFRIDRPRQLTRAFVQPDFETRPVEKLEFDPYAEKYGLHQYQLPKGGTTTFKRAKIIKDLFFVTMTEYERGLPAQVAFGPDTVKLPLSRIISENGLRQFHLAETEKERFITYYFNGQREDPFPGEDRIEIPSPNVPTYDQKPEMSAYGVTTELIKRLKTDTYDFVVVNFANPDMLGHTGVFKAGVKACEVVDECIGRVVAAVYSRGGLCAITADHGNVEEMINLQTGKVDTEHSSNPVPFIIIGRDFATNNQVLPRGVLADVAPTLLGIMEIKKPDLMTGRNLLQ